MPRTHTRRELLKTGSAAATVIGSASLSGCISGVMGGGGNVKIGSKRFVEQRILGFMSYEAIKANTDLNAVDETGLGGSVSNFRALNSGKIGHYWEYTGTAWSTFPPKHENIPNSPDVLYEKLKEEFEQKHNIAILNRAKFNNTYVILANPKWVEKTGVKTISELAEYINNGHTDLTAVMSAQELERADGWPGLIKHYDFVKAAKKIDTKTVSPELTYQAVGKGEAEIGFGYNTNPKITKFNLQTLDDDKNFFPPYNPVPMVNGKTLEQHPAMKEPLNAIGPKLKTEKMRSLNKRVSIDGESAQKVAKEFLREKNII